MHIPQKMITQSVLDRNVTHYVSTCQEKSPTLTLCFCTPFISTLKGLRAQWTTFTFSFYKSLWSLEAKLYLLIELQFVYLFSKLSYLKERIKIMSYMTSLVINTPHTNFTSKGTHVMQSNPNLQSYSWIDNMYLKFTIVHYFQHVSTTMRIHICPKEPMFIESEKMDLFISYRH